MDELTYEEEFVGDFEQASAKDYCPECGLVIIMKIITADGRRAIVIHVPGNEQCRIRQNELKKES